MRCPECGSANNESAKICTNCGTKLTNVESSPNEGAHSASNEGKTTIKGIDAMNQAWDAPAGAINPQQPSRPEIETGSISKCPKCSHYPLVKDKQGIDTCLNCGYKNTVSDRIDEPEKKMVEVPSKKKTQALRDIQLPGGIGFKLSEVHSGKSITFEGVHVILSRDALEKDNPSISSGEHATIVYQDGTWKIKDHSTNKATFVQVLDDISLTHGQVILIGNRFYRFESE